MQSIKDLLGKFSNLKAPNETVRKLFSEVAQKVAGLEINFSDISLKEKVFKINASPLVKNSILINQKKILDSIEKETGVRYENIR